MDYFRANDVQIFFRRTGVILTGRWNHAAVVVVFLGTIGCTILYPRLPAVNLADPGWRVLQGQAVWTLPQARSEIAGEVLVALGPNEHSLIQFTKSPFTLVDGQTTAGRWEVEFPPQKKRYAGPGSPPQRLLWLYLPRVLAGKPPPAGWTWKNLGGDWVLSNPATGEKLEGFVAQ